MIMQTELLRSIYETPSRKVFLGAIKKSKKESNWMELN